MDKQSNRLNVLALALALATVWGATMFLFSLLANFFHIGGHLVEVIGNIYYGYSSSFFGGVVGALYGFFDGFVFGALIAWLYNFYSCCCCKKSAQCTLDQEEK